MLGRGFVAVRLTFAGASAFIKKLRPSSSTTLAMCPLLLCANNGAKNEAENIAHRASVARISHPQFVALLSIHHASAVRHTLRSSSNHTAAIILERPVAVNATSVLCALDLLVSMPLSRWGLRPPRPRLVAQNTPGNANLAIGVVSEWNRTEPTSHTTAPRSTSIITRPPPGRGRSARPFLGQLCLFRQLRLGQVCRPPYRLPLVPMPASACQHGF